MSFIDEHCIVFDDDEENKLEYTTIHNAFKKLFEGLIDKLLGEIGLDAQSFAHACEKVSVKLYKDIVGQIVAMDNFLVFKKMMVARNKALNAEAMGGASSGAAAAGASTAQEEVDEAAYEEAQRQKE